MILYYLYVLWVPGLIIYYIIMRFGSDNDNKKGNNYNINEY